MPEIPTRRGRHSTTASSRLALVLVALLAASGIFLGGYTLGAHVATTPGTPASEESRFQPFWDVYSLIQNSFAGSPKPSPDALVRAAITGMMQSLNDPYSYYQAPADFQNTLQNVGGQAVGVGIQVELEPVDPASTQECTKIGGGCQLAVVEPIPGSPADKAGVKAGDVLVSVNGTTLDGLTVDQASALIKGDKGTKATLQIDRAGQRLDIAVIRDVFDLPQVATKSLAAGKVAYISLSQFGDAAATQFTPPSRRRSRRAPNRSSSTSGATRAAWSPARTRSRASSSHRARSSTRSTPPEPRLRFRPSRAGWPPTPQ
jgi:carboxyl-terminal processing protease